MIAGDISFADIIISGNWLVEPKRKKLADIPNEAIERLFNKWFNKYNWGLVDRFDNQPIPWKL